jgi:hypothetical protein
LIIFTTTSLADDDEFSSIDYSAVIHVISHMKTAHYNTQHCKNLNLTLPASSVMFTITSNKTIETLTIQQESMDFWVPGLKACLNTKFIVICTDNIAEMQCKDLPHVHCVFVDFSQALALSRPRNSYYFFTYIKYEIMNAIMAQAQVDVFYFDLDVLIFKDPWSNLDDIIESNHTYVNYQVHDILFQYECGFSGLKDNNICDRNGHDINGGQILIKYSSKAKSFFDYFKRRRYDILRAPEGVLDQKFIGPAAIAAGLSKCGLNRWHYTSVCQAANCKSNDDAAFEGIVTLHAACVRENKNTQLRKYLARGKQNPKAKLGDIVKI